MPIRTRFSALFIALAGLFVSSAALAQEAAPETGGGSVSTFVMPRSGPYSPDRIEIPNARAIAAWIRSGHSDASSEAFVHWDEDGAIPPNCSVCHSGAGFRSYHGLDGSAPGLPEAPVPTGGVVDCGTCHDPGLGRITEVALPSGVMHPVTSSAEAACVTCHQARSSGASVTKAAGDLGEDEVGADLGFVNPHYAGAAASNFGSYGKLGYQYDGKDYTGRFLHAKPVSGCLSCHDPHSLEVTQDTCLICHQTGDDKAIRISRQSYDGSGDTSKGIYEDIKANSAVLMSAIEAYAAGVAGVPVVYDGAHHPYFFADANGDGLVDQAAGKPVRYNAWTPRMLKAAYNWKVVNADHGIHVHNPHYALELLYDSTEDLYAATGGDFAALGLNR
ncbi:cytochrome c3 family protein [Poseidonocella sp. HB161398]|uniref:cytochrome c3 family protein n=1 Tax=Poseidonocella sp. HB161398 TaxID=2320855 RepID=UPI001981A30F|nr:cytochrome c3 family protein [Poseidonocella sp. HB161398]